MRLIQSISSGLQNGLWRASFRVETCTQLRSGSRFGLWESLCGLIFFDPIIADDAAFYRSLYSDWDEDGRWTRTAPQRADHARAATLIKSSDRVLAIGCGNGVARKLTGKNYFRHARTWHCGLLWSFLAARVSSAMLGTPRRAKPVELLLIARKPPAAAR